MSSFAAMLNTLNSDWYIRLLVFLLFWRRLPCYRWVCPITEWKKYIELYSAIIDNSLVTWSPLWHGWRLALPYLYSPLCLCISLIPFIKFTTFIGESSIRFNMHHILTQKQTSSRNCATNLKLNDSAQKRTLPSKTTNKITLRPFIRPVVKTESSNDA